MIACVVNILITCLNPSFTGFATKCTKKGVFMSDHLF